MGEAFPGYLGFQEKRPEVWCLRAWAVRSTGVCLHGNGGCACVCMSSAGHGR